MRLRRLRLINFRQHADTTLEFEAGLTGIIGPNGAGKSTLLEAIAWAMYGTPAARGTLDSIRRRNAPPRSRVEVELEFVLGQGIGEMPAFTPKEKKPKASRNGSASKTGIVGLKIGASQVAAARVSNNGSPQLLQVAAI